MLQTAEQVAKRYNIGRERMDEYGAASQQKACAAQAAGLFNDEIAPITVTRRGRQGHGPAHQGSHREQRRRHPPGTTWKASADALGLPGGVITAGNASQFSATAPAPAW
jgi:acetyl-CoA C-acetyltransferase